MKYQQLVFCVLLLAKLSYGFVDMADRDVTVFVQVPVEKKLTVPAGESFRAITRDFCADNGLDDFVRFSFYEHFRC